MHKTYLILNISICKSDGFKYKLGQYLFGLLPLLIQFWSVDKRIFFHCGIKFIFLARS